MNNYTAGVVRKSRREKEQEAAEAKKREEETEAAKAYAEFIDAFEGDGRKSGSTFVKAGTSAQAGPSSSSSSAMMGGARGFMGRVRLPQYVVILNAYSCP